MSFEFAPKKKTADLVSIIVMVIPLLWLAKWGVDYFSLLRESKVAFSKPILSVTYPKVGDLVGAIAAFIAYFFLTGYTKTRADWKKNKTDVAAKTIYLLGFLVFLLSGALWLDRVVLRPHYEGLFRSSGFEMCEIKRVGQGKNSVETVVFKKQCDQLESGKAVLLAIKET